MKDLQAAIEHIVATDLGYVSIAIAIRRVREMVGTALPDVELEKLIGIVAAERGKAILFDRPC